MAAHLERLAEEYGANLNTWMPPPEASARLIRSSFNAPEIYMPMLRTRSEYYAGLHEFGHLHVGSLGQGSLGEITGLNLYDEMNAWE